MGVDLLKRIYYAIFPKQKDKWKIVQLVGYDTYKILDKKLEWKEKNERKLHRNVLLLPLSTYLPVFISSLQVGHKFFSLTYDNQLDKQK